MIPTRGGRRDFNPLPPRGGRPLRRHLRRLSVHFNPLPPRGGRPELIRLDCLRVHFNPLPPRGGRPPAGTRWPGIILFQSTPSSRRETRLPHARQRMKNISIHSLLAEGDPSPLPPLKTDVYFNPLPPRGGRRESGTSKRTKGAISIHSLLAEGDTPSLRRSKRPV